jgi:hypothetical protein
MPDATARTLLWPVVRLLMTPLIPPAQSDTSCITVKGEDCTTVNIPPWVAILLVLLGGFVVYQLVRIADLFKGDSDPHRHPQRRRPAQRRPAINAPTADHLEALAERTGRYQRYFAWMDPLTITGKLTFATWISRWWAGGKFLRKVLLWEVVKIVVITSALTYVILRYT